MFQYLRYVRITAKAAVDRTGEQTTSGDITHTCVHGRPIAHSKGPSRLQMRTSGQPPQSFHDVPTGKHPSLHGQGVEAPEFRSTNINIYFRKKTDFP